jgi:hypothetical protein
MLDAPPPAPTAFATAPPTTATRVAGLEPRSQSHSFFFVNDALKSKPKSLSTASIYYTVTSLNIVTLSVKVKK